MKIIKPSFYKDFQCIAGACPDSCCQGWEVDADEASLAYYRTLDPSLEIRQRIDRVLDKDEFDNTIFTLAPKKRCPFLNAENLCDMHIAIGQEHTPDTCRNFPRFFYDYGGTREIGISFSCPVAADMMYNLSDDWTFEEEVTPELPSLNDIDAQWFFALKKARSAIYKTLQNEQLSVPERLMLAADICRPLTQLADEYGVEAPVPTDDIDFFDVFKNPELINPEWEEKRRHAAVKPVENCRANANIAMYFIYKYFLSAAYDYDVESKLKMAIIGVLIHTYFGADAWTVHLWSKETEHSQYNMDRYKRLLREAKCLSLDYLITLLNKQ